MSSGFILEITSALSRRVDGEYLAASLSRESLQIRLSVNLIEAKRHSSCFDLRLYCRVNFFSSDVVKILARASLLWRLNRLDFRETLTASSVTKMMPKLELIFLLTADKLLRSQTT